MKEGRCSSSARRLHGMAWGVGGAHERPPSQRPRQPARAAAPACLGKTHQSSVRNSTFRSSSALNLSATSTATLATRSAEETVTNQRTPAACGGAACKGHGVDRRRRTSAPRGLQHSQAVPQEGLSPPATHLCVAHVLDAQPRFRSSSSARRRRRLLPVGRRRQRRRRRRVCNTSGRIAAAKRRHHPGWSRLRHAASCGFVGWRERGLDVRVRPAAPKQGAEQERDVGSVRAKADKGVSISQTAQPTRLPGCRQRSHSCCPALLTPLPVHALTTGPLPHLSVCR